MAGAGFKNFTTGEVLTASDVQGYLMDQSVMVFAGTAARASAIPSPSEGMVTYRSDDDAVEVYDGSAWSSIGGVGAAVISSPAATGSYSSGGTTYNYYTFTASGTVTVDTAGFADVLVVGGGGGSTAGATNYGGGAGGYIYISQYYLDAGSYSVTVGAGGAASSDGSDSIIDGNYAIGGGKGYSDPSFGGSSGGSNGASYMKAVTGQGNLGYGTGSYRSGGGAGGAATSGANGAGLANSITGSSVTRAAGGSAYVIGAGSANTGNGAGGSTTSAAGGSGVVIIRVAV